jgi:capsular polysaccharide biosynthesis protein/Mrp family chromosome partitioning ATPase
MDLKAYLRLLRFHWVAIVLLVISGGAAGFAVAQIQPPTYAAKAQMFVTVSADRQTSSEAYQGALLAQQRARSYATLLTSQAVLRQLRDQLGLPYTVGDMKQHISATNPTDTAVIDVTTKDHSARRALQIANGVAPVAANVVANVENPPQPGVTATDRTPAIGIKALERAELLEHPVSPHKAFDIVLGLVVGLVLGVGWAVSRELSVGRIRDPQDLTQAADVDILGALPRTDKSGRGFRPGGRRSAAEIEAYRWLALNLEATAPGRGPRAYVLATPTHQGGTPAVAAGLAVAVAESGTRVIVADAGESGTEMSNVLGLSSAWSLRDVLSGRVSVGEALVSWRDDVSLTVLSGGSATPAAQAPPLRQPDIARLCEELALHADVVILVGPPVLAGSEATILARATGRIVLLVEAKYTPGPDLASAAQRLRSLDVTVLGAVLSGAKERYDGPYVPTASPHSTRLDGHDFRGSAGARSQTAAWSQTAHASTPAEARGEP